MLGAFRFNESISSAIGKLIKGSGGPCLLMEPGVFSPLSVIRFLKGKMYNRCRRCHIILLTALHWLHFQSVLLDTHTDIDFTDELKVWLGTKSDQLQLFFYFYFFILFVSTISNKYNTNVIVLTN